MTAIYKKELKAYFVNMTGYIFIAFILLIMGIYTTIINLVSLYPNFEYVLTSSCFIFLIIVPILTMRVLAEEARQKTDQLLFSSPVAVSKIVIGKFLALLTVFLIPMLIVALYPIILSFFGTVSLKMAYGTLAGFFFLGGALIAVGMFMSSLTENQIIAAVTGFGIMLLAYMMTYLSSLVSSSALASLLAWSVLAVLLGLLIKYALGSVSVSLGVGVVLELGLIILYFAAPTALEGSFAKMLTTLSLFDRLDNFATGIFDITSLIYYATVMCLFIFFSIQSVEKKRWS